MTDSDRLREIRERAEKATPGPWLCWNGYPLVGDNPRNVQGIHRIGPKGSHDGLRGYAHTPMGGDGDLYATVEDAEFAACARDDVPYLLSEVARLSAEVGQLRQENAELKGAYALTDAEGVQKADAMAEENYRLRVEVEALKAERVAFVPSDADLLEQLWSQVRAMIVKANGIIRQVLPQIETVYSEIAIADLDDPVADLCRRLRLAARASSPEPKEGAP